MTADADDLTTVPGRVDTRWIGGEHQHYASVDSTNDRAVAWARAGAPHGALVTADEQTSGRGRRGRTWHSPRGCSVYCSVVVRPGPIGDRLGPLGLVAGLGLAEGLAPYVPGLELKWPNDLRVGQGRGLGKFGGILCESRWSDGEPEVVVGFGLNVHRIAFPPELENVATTLAEVGVPMGRAEVLAVALEGLEPVLDQFFADGFEPLRARYERFAPTLRGVLFISDSSAPDERRQVEALGLERDGALLVREDDGRIHRLDAGDVWLTPR